MIQKTEAVIDRKSPKSALERWGMEHNGREDDIFYVVFLMTSDSRGRGDSKKTLLIQGFALEEAHIYGYEMI